jgi:hypothetical protein
MDQGFDRAVLIAAASYLMKDAPTDARIAISEMRTGEGVFAAHGQAIAAAVRGRVLARGESATKCAVLTDDQGYNRKHCELDGFDFALQPLGVEVKGETATATFMKTSTVRGRIYSQMLRVHLSRTGLRWEATQVEKLGES